MTLQRGAMGVRGFGTTAGVCASSTLLVACGNFEPTATRPPDETETVYIAVPGNSTEDRVLGKLYELVLDSHGRPTAVQLVNPLVETPIQKINSGYADLMIGCTGELLAEFDRVAARELAAEFEAAGGQESNSGKRRDLTYDALLGALASHFAATDPSNAEGCAGSSAESTELPQNIITMYRKPSMTREDRQIFNRVGGTISTKDVAELVRESELSGTRVKSVEEYIEQTGM